MQVYIKVQSFPLYRHTIIFLSLLKKIYHLLAERAHGIGIDSLSILQKQFILLLLSVINKKSEKEIMKEEHYYDDEVDLREFFLTLLGGWKVILLLTVLLGAAAFGYSKLQTPVYEASVVILVDQTSLVLKTSPVTLLGSDEVRQLVAEKTEISVTALPSASIVNDTTDKTLFTLTVQSTNAQEAAKIANAWAETGLELFDQQLQEASASVDIAMANIAEADRALVNYLAEHSLSAWTWVDLSALTGVSNAGFANMQVNINTPNLPEISDKERLEIAELMRARIATEEAYAIALNQAVLLDNAAEVSPPAMLNKATAASSPINQKTLMNTALGLVLGGMLGVFWVFAAVWWKGSAAEEEKAI
jgi:uncharacterized protein involved in exopolysaccharide biosynthesis